jgi:hypothetical protein
MQNIKAELILFDLIKKPFWIDLSSVLETDGRSIIGVSNNDSDDDNEKHEWERECYS